MNSRPLMVGWGHTPFGKHDALDLEQRFREATQPALAMPESGYGKIVKKDIREQLLSAIRA